MFTFTKVGLFFTIVLLMVGCSSVPSGPSTNIGSEGNKSGTTSVAADNPQSNRKDQLSFFNAVRAGDVIGTSAAIDGGANVNDIMEHGNTALHTAFYNKQVSLIESLLKADAANNIQNEYGLLPSQMWQLAEIEQILKESTEMLSDQGYWLKRDRARLLYDNLLENDGSLIVAAIVSHILKRPESRTKTLVLAMKLGVAGTEKRLNAILMSYGDKRMAEDYLNSSSRALVKGGRTWATENGYQINKGSGSQRATWGEF